MVKQVLQIVALLMFATVTSAHGTYKIQAGDTVRIEVLEDASLNRDVLVLPDGRISLPLVGSIQVAGKSIVDVKAAVEEAMAPSFSSRPTVFANVISLVTPDEREEDENTVSIFVMGEVNSPGKVLVKPGTNILQSLAQVGGFTPFAATKRIQVRRTDGNSGSARIFEFNYKAIEKGIARAEAIILREGDVIVVPERRLFE